MQHSIPSANAYTSSSAPYMQPQNLTAEAVASLPPPGLSGPSSLEFVPGRKQSGRANFLVFVSTSAKSRSVLANRRSRANVDPALAAAANSERQICILDLHTFEQRPLLKIPSKRRFDSSEHQQSNASFTSDALSLEERLRRERQRLNASGNLTQFCWAYDEREVLRVLVPIRGSLYVQDGVDSYLKVLYDKHSLDHLARSSNISPPPPTAAIDPQLSPDGQLYAFCALGEIFVSSASECQQPVQITFGADLRRSVSHGLADFVAQEEMDRYRGFWWSPDSEGIVFAKVDESKIPPYRIIHHEHEATSNSCVFEDHRYPFAGKANPKVRLAYVQVDSASLGFKGHGSSDMSSSQYSSRPSSHPSEIAEHYWRNTIWFDPPREASEYLARLTFLPDGSACAQWQNRTQNCLVLSRMDLNSGRTRSLLVERSDSWINLHRLMHCLGRPIHPRECDAMGSYQHLPDTLPEDSFSFVFGSERSGFCHLYLYTYIPNFNADQAMLIRQLSAGDWMIESIAGSSLKHNAIYVTGTFDSVLEKHLYALPILANQNAHLQLERTVSSYPVPQPTHTGNQNGVRRGLKQVIDALSGKSSNSALDDSETDNHNGPTSMVMETTGTPPGVPNLNLFASTPLRLTVESGIHSIVIDPDCTKMIDTCSDLGRPPTVKIFEIPEYGPFHMLQSSARIAELPLLFTLYDATRDDKSMDLSSEFSTGLLSPELMMFPSSDGTETLHAALYRPDARVHGPGPYPLVCAVYGGPHVQRVNRSWSQCADMRAQRLRSLGFCVVKCDNRGSSRRGTAFESAIARRLGRMEVLDQVAVVRQLTVRGIADPTRVGIYGWSYGGYLSAMCLCRAPDVFHVAVAGAPVTSWDGYDTHYTERYMGLPSENPNGYRESAIFDHVPNMRGKLLLVHGLIDENVHFRHTTRLINRLIAAGKDYDLLLFPDERHSPRRLRDRIYMEQRISDYFLKHLSNSHNSAPVRAMAGL
ncbi:unnamed protein product [Cylindrotheca closterium]|uniref:Dipeptidyl peptidase 9 n=1 Tax=Cylindrotheca closterium TaxID=2856 RepID=A0AAD2CV46_9STRA|nr:unnamed protein product [Cylindrotheca closterium]